MRLRRWLCVMLLLAGFVGVAYVGQEKDTPGAKMARAGEAFLATLTPEQKAKATFAFDDQERFNWHFVPLQDENKKATRKGLSLEEMTADQKKAAKALLEAGTSREGYTKATTIMSLEALLHELEKGGRTVRNPDWYFFSIFGAPANKGKWGWRVEGHHLSINITLEDGNVVSSTPAFFGANPAMVKAGDKKGLRTLPEAEDLARELFQSLTDEQKKVAVQPKQFPEIKAKNKAPEVAAPVGLPAEKMDEKQRAILVKLLRGYTERMPPEVAQREMKQVIDAGLEKVHFAIAFGKNLDEGEPKTYRIQGPTFLVEFLNMQPDGAGNPANHIHSCWRSLKNDFGLAAK